MLLKLITSLFLLSLLVGCSAPSALIVNGASKHLTQTGKDHTNVGLGVRFNNTELGVFDNSRVFDSLSYYASHRVWQRGRYFFDAGGAYYDGQGSYDSKLVPVLTLGARFGPVEVGINPVDLVVGRLVFD